MEAEATFTVMWDSGASYSITPCKEDFVEFKSHGVLKRLSGLAKGLAIKGEGTVEWTFIDTFGNFRTLHIPAYYVPSAPVRLMGTASVLQAYPGELINLSAQSARLTGIDGNPDRAPIEAYVNSSNNIPTSTVYRWKRVKKAAAAFNTMATEVSENNLNLSEAEKELLRWHQ